MKKALLELASSTQRDLAKKIAIHCAERAIAPLFLSQDDDELIREKLKQFKSTVSNLRNLVQTHPAFDDHDELIAIYLVEEELRQLHLVTIQDRQKFLNEITKRSVDIASRISILGDDWGLIKTSDLNSGIQWFNLENMEMHLHQTIPGSTNASLWLSDLICNIPRSDKSYIRPDSFRIRPCGSSFMRMEKAAVFGKPFNITWIKNLRGVQSAQHEPNPLAVFNEGHVSQFLWERITKNKVQFSCEELPFYHEPEKVDDTCVTRFVHGIYNTELDAFQHFDGALHIYTSEQYKCRIKVHLKEHFNDYLKAKIFLFDTYLKIDLAEKLLSVFYRWNQMIPEYFSHH